MVPLYLMEEIWPDGCQRSEYIYFSLMEKIKEATNFSACTDVDMFEPDYVTYVSDKAASLWAENSSSCVS